MAMQIYICGHDMLEHVSEYGYGVCHCINDFCPYIKFNPKNVTVAEQADAADLKSAEDKPRESSILSGHTTYKPGKVIEPFPTYREERIKILEQQEGVMEDYLQMKVDNKDWHGVQDAASDLRDIESELKGLKS